MWQVPIGTNEMTCIAIREPFQVIPMFSLRRSEWTRRRNSVTTLRGQIPDASTSAIVSFAVRICASVVEKIAER